MAYGPILLTLYTTPHNHRLCHHKVHHHLYIDTHYRCLHLIVFSKMTYNLNLKLSPVKTELFVIGPKKAKVHMCVIYVRIFLFD